MHPQDHVLPPSLSRSSRICGQCDAGARRQKSPTAARRASSAPPTATGPTPGSVTSPRKRTGTFKRHRTPAPAPANRDTGPPRHGPCQRRTDWSRALHPALQCGRVIVGQDQLGLQRTPRALSPLGIVRGPSSRPRGSNSPVSITSAPDPTGRRVVGAGVHTARPI